MIKSFKHKGLEQFFYSGITKGIQSEHVAKVSRILSALNAASKALDMNLPSYKLHKLKGDKSEFWSVTVNGNWRVIFKFEDGDAYIVNYLDYH
ncbi:MULTISPECIES: type II toxin-antitoxin system RelE/ParE family toxin [Cysteiniphilum]|uniref:Protein killer protein n=1 Tax=Cysteiniphilum litorale TaxID=2056700 RepID=A0A8J2Z3B1_9GAMM|nr:MULTISPECIES: type II toxin-antitoxin system RelE/ParE family toxin [Cysteiniphilum]WHN65595.1 type II toxin-antitoxin system RelE/ParE family toxin [Cysteiniphilum sp. QT6929]GGF90402.1 protein killer protein [Cysteiniphilum litorale]